MDFKTHFPFLNEGIYFNTASIGLSSNRLLATKKAVDLRYHHEVFQLNLEEDELIDCVRENVAHHLGAKKELTGLVPNFSYGMNALAEALPQGSKILLLRTDYPSVNLPLESRGFKISYAEINGHLEENIYEALEKFTPDFFVFSEVQFLNGILLTQEFLYLIKKDFSQTRLICDATQSAGTGFFDFEKSPFDAYGASAYKWLHAGWGNGFFLFKEDFFETIQPKSIGSNSKAYKPDGPIRKVGFLEPGHWDLNAFLSLKTALDFHYNEIGIKTIKQQIDQVNNYAFEAFKKLNLLETSVSQRSEHGPIVNLQLPDQFLEYCIENKVYCAKRGSGIRCSFHFFNSLKEVDFLLELINKFLHKK